MKQCGKILAILTAVIFFECSSLFAAGAPVFDLSNFIQSVKEYYMDYNQIKDQIDYWTEQAENFSDATSKLTSGDWSDIINAKNQYISIMNETASRYGAFGNEWIRLVNDLNDLSDLPDNFDTAIAYLDDVQDVIDRMDDITSDDSTTARAIEEQENVIDSIGASEGVVASNLEKAMDSESIVEQNGLTMQMTAAMLTHQESQRLDAANAKMEESIRKDLEAMRDKLAEHAYYLKTIEDSKEIHEKWNDLFPAGSFAKSVSY